MTCQHCDPAFKPIERSGTCNDCADRRQTNLDAAWSKIKKSWIVVAGNELVGKFTSLDEIRIPEGVDLRTVRIIAPNGMRLFINTAALMLPRPSIDSPYKEVVSA